MDPQYAPLMVVIFLSFAYTCIPQKSPIPPPTSEQSSGMNIDERVLQIRDGCENSSAEGRLSERGGHTLLQEMGA
jgi:hypothetical protein